MMKRGSQPNSYKKLRVKIASLRYGSKSNTARLILVTGNHGKSTVVRLIAELLRESGAKVVEMMAAADADHSFETDPFLLHRRLADASRQGYDYVVMEVHAALVASHALPTLTVEMAVATTDSPELTAVTTLGVRYVVLPYGLTPPAGVQHHNLITFGTDEKADMRVVSHSLYRKGTEVSLIIDMHTKLDVASYLVGEANALNIATALAAVYVLGVDVAKFADGIARVERIAGNFDYLRHNAPFLIAVDQGGADDSLLRLIDNAKQLAKRRLLVALDTAAQPTVLDSLRKVADRVVVVGDSADPDAARDHEEAAFIVVRGAKKDDLVLLVGRRYADYDDEGSARIAGVIGGSRE
jgi:UDP-N-acetylmuramyl tripeptide synthase